MNEKIGLTGLVDPKVALFELLKIYNDTKSNSGVTDRLLESMALVITQDLISRREFDFTQYFSGLFKKAGREDLVEMVENKQRVVKTLIQLIKGNEILLRRACNMCMRQIGEAGDDVSFISEETLIREKISKTLLYCKTNRTNAIISFSLSGEQLQLRLHPENTTSSVLRQLIAQTGKKPSCLKVQVPIGFRVGFILEEVKVFAIGASKSVATIVDNCLIIIDPNTDISSIAAEFENSRIGISKAA